MSLSSLRYAIALLSLWLAIAAILLLPGNFWLKGHEVDFIHALDIASRINLGEWPHIDYQTPLGLFTHLPLALFLDMGYGPGRSFMLSQILVTALLLPGIWWVGASRLSAGLRLVYGMGMVLLGLALVHGGTEPMLASSMNYNRWGWILASFVVLVLMLPARPGWRAPVVDGVLVGAAGATLLMLKMTYFVALLPFVLAALLVDRPGRLFLAAVAGFAAVMAPVVVGLGPGFLLAYADDLVQVATQAKRAYPGRELGDLLASPATLPITALLLTTIVFWRRIGMYREGLLLFVLAPGLIYITYQNWGNDPQWLFVLGILLLALLPGPDRKPFYGQPPRGVAAVLAVLSFVWLLPSMTNVAFSPLRHLLQEPEDFLPIFNDLAKGDVKMHRDVLDTPLKRIEFSNYPFETDSEYAKQRRTAEFNGEHLSYCGLELGFMAWTRWMVEQMGAIEEAVGRRVLVADNYDHLWLFGPFERLPHMAPWYYDADEGFEEAEYVMVPFCPVSDIAWERKLELIAEKGWVLEEVIRTELFILARRAG
ncbi:hypothetical protein HMH01_12470 [Halovulum dunhuangense]|uniref:Dolichyl-phosphate-mannose-protein mannosyltransferase n=1 Tax=Halovulum dunhuangense TaxID=1505036 RepID=A0A849L531_9RHOB|nr:hypothetical protein [Halovulum dunhuangense]NNU81251.1 hypothetical protein [Halovulum dunhuangense]